jgi:hypothetical protein
MLLRLKIIIYNIKRGSPSILKAALNYNLYIVLTVIYLNYFSILVLVYRSEYLFVS